MLTLHAYEPLTISNLLYSRDYIDDITLNHEGYTHTILAVGGYNTANFVLKGTLPYLKDWYADGIMRRIVLYNPEGIISWEGAVTRIRLNEGARQKTKSIEDFYNRVYMAYAPLDTSVSPPVAGEPVTLIFDNTAQQTDYGVRSIVVSGGERADNTAYNWGRTVLKEKSKKMPEGEQGNTKGGDFPFLEIECKGYWHFLKWLPYIKNVSGRIQCNEIVQEILQYFNDINPGWLSMDFSNIRYNYNTDRRGRTSLETCQDILVDVIKKGGLGGERWVGGFYQNREFIYKAAEDLESLYGEEFKIIRSLNDPKLLFYDGATGTEIKPWDMVPDRILKTVDIEGTVEEENLTYIEEITFAEPYSVTYTGSDDTRLSIYLAQKGLPGA
jgi:hypothetical protein